TGWEAGGSPESIATNSRQQRVRVVREKSTWKRAQSAGKNHGVEGLAAELRSQIISDCSLVWLGGRDSNPDTVVQSHVSYRWTTSQCQSRRFEAARTCDYSRSDTSGKRTIRKGRATTGGWPRRGAHGNEPGSAERRF